MSLSAHHFSRFHTAFIVPLLFFSSCAGPSLPPDSRLSPPEHWQNSPDKNPASPEPQNLALWWQNFNDPILDRLIRDALADSPDVRIALSKVLEARAERGISKSNLLPTLEAGVSASDRYSRNRKTGESDTGDNYEASLDAGWEIDLFGKQNLLLEAATAAMLETQENYYAAQVSLAAEVAAAYIDLRSYEIQLAVVLENIRTRERTTQIAQWQEQSGMADALATQQALSTLEQARASIPSLRQNIVESRNKLALLSGRTPGSLDELLSTAGKIPTPPEKIALGIPADTLRQRPDIRAAEHALTAAIARNQSARRERLPSLNLNGSIGVDALRAGDLFSPSTIFASIAGGLTAPIFSGGRISQDILIRDEQQKQAYIQYESAVLSALSEVENALTALYRNGERIASLQKAAAAAIKASDMAYWQYESGEADILTVLDAQRTRLNMEEQLASAEAARAKACVQLYKALGGGWAPDPELLTRK